jgi:hypothetical protein
MYSKMLEGRTNSFLLLLQLTNQREIALKHKLLVEFEGDIQMILLHIPRTVSPIDRLLAKQQLKFLITTLLISTGWSNSSLTIGFIVKTDLTRFLFFDLRILI